MSQPLRNLVGERFGRLVILSQYIKNHETKCLCLCDCGKEKEASGSALIFAGTGGGVKSCGCLQRETMVATGKKTGPVNGPKNVKRAIEASTTHGMTHTPEYTAYDGMVARCQDLSPKGYGARGIAVCPEWLGPGGFEAWYAYIGPQARTEIRILPRSLS